MSGTSATWVELSSSGDIPGGRSGHAMAVLPDGFAVMFGGWDGPNSNHAKNDIYSLVVSGVTATWVELSSSGNTPVGRQGHSMVVLDDGTAVMFGQAADGAEHDIYKLTVSGTTATWAELSSSGDTPESRYYHTMTVLPDGTTVMFGGYTYPTYLDDMYKLIVSGTTATLVELSSSGDIPGVRSHHTSTVLHDGTVVIFGGVEWYPGDSYYDHSTKNDIYQLSVSTQSPTPLPTPLPTPWPTQLPTRSPTPLPTRLPATLPTPWPTQSPTRSPNPLPTRLPTKSPMPWPTQSPTRSPTQLPTRSPTPQPTRLPTASPTP